MIDEFCCYCGKVRDDYATYETVSPSYEVADDFLDGESDEEDRRAAKEIRGDVSEARSPPLPNRNASRPIEQELPKQLPVRNKQDTSRPTVPELEPIAPDVYPSPAGFQLAESPEQHPVRNEQDTSRPTVRRLEPIAPDVYPSPAGFQLAESPEIVLSTFPEPVHQVLDKSNIDRAEILGTRSDQDAKDDEENDSSSAGGQAPQSVVTEVPCASPVDVDSLQDENHQGNPEKHSQDQVPGHRGKPESYFPHRGLWHYLAQLSFMVMVLLRLSPRVGCCRITWICVSTFQSSHSFFESITLT